MVTESGQTQEPLPQDGQTEHGDEQPGGQTQPRIELLRQDRARGEENQQPQGNHPGGVGDGDGQPEEERVTGRAPVADQIGADDGLAMSGGEGVHRAPCRRGEKGQEQAAGGKRPAVDDRLQTLAEPAGPDAIGVRSPLAAGAPGESW